MERQMEETTEVNQGAGWCGKRVGCLTYVVLKPLTVGKPTVVLHVVIPRAILTGPAVAEFQMFRDTRGPHCMV